MLYLSVLLCFACCLLPGVVINGRVVVVEKTVEKYIRWESDSNKAGFGALLDGVDGTGKATSCGPKGYNFSLTWNPEPVDPRGVLNAELDMVAPVKFDLGKYTVDVYIDGVTTPIFSITDKLACKDVQKSIKELKCPIKPKDHIKAHITRRNLSNIPSGKYKIEVNVFNEDNDRFACAKLNIVMNP